MLINIEKKSLKDNFLNYSSMLENITNLSGVDMISSGTGIQKVVVRGLSGMRVVTFLNGMKINNQQWANDHGIGFTDLGLDAVELIKGSSALKFGSEAIGGVLYFKDDPCKILKSQKNKVEIFKGEASFKSSKTVEIKSKNNMIKEITSKNICIASGGRPREISGVPNSVNVFSLFNQFLKKKDFMMKQKITF